MSCVRVRDSFPSLVEEVEVAWDLSLVTSLNLLKIDDDEMLFMN